LRLDGILADVRTFDGNEFGTEGGESGLDTLPPIGGEGNGARDIIGSDGDGITRGFAGLGAAEFEGVEDSILGIVRDATNVL
jgi:hypothetical protein